MLPATITFCIFLALTLIATAISPVVRIKRLPAFFISLSLSVIAFIPACVGIETAVDKTRFGLFNYPSYQAIQDIRVERYLPPSATEIVIEKFPQGYNAKFKIRKDELDSWFDQHWKNQGRFSAMSRSELNHREDTEMAFFKQSFGHLNWQRPNDARLYVGPIAANGAGFYLWYSDSQTMAYQQSGYW